MSKDPKPTQKPANAVSQVMPDNPHVLRSGTENSLQPFQEFFEFALSIQTPAEIAGKSLTRPNTSKHRAAGLRQLLVRRCQLRGPAAAIRLYIGYRALKQAGTVIRSTPWRTSTISKRVLCWAPPSPGLRPVLRWEPRSQARTRAAARSWRARRGARAGDQSGCSLKRAAISALWKRRCVAAVPRRPCAGAGRRD